MRDKRCRHANCRWNLHHPHPAPLPRGDQRVRKLRCARTMEGCGHCIARAMRREPHLLAGTLAPERTMDVHEPLDAAVLYESAAEEEDLERDEE